MWLKTFWFFKKKYFNKAWRKIDINYCLTKQPDVAGTYDNSFKYDLKKLKDFYILKLKSLKYS